MKNATARRLSAIHRIAFQLTGGVVGRRFVENDMLLLTTTGRRTGSRHTVPLLYLPDGDDVVVIASWGGRREHPEWYLNLVAADTVDVQLHRRRFRGRAAGMPEPERTLWWELAVAAYDGYAGYQTKTTRVIPVVRITPI